MRWSTRLIVGVLLLVAAAWVVYWVADPERLELDASVRGSAPGQFVSLTEGFTHYELGGPSDGRVVVLAAGFSVPYYIWDPTFSALVGAGFRVLRYDYYGRGYSDRPAVSDTPDLYVRQLAQLLDALGIRDPVALAGLSFGGSVVTSFADRYPERVRSLIYIDPAFREPRALPFLTGWPFAWNFVTAIFDERSWADAQRGDFLHPERFPDWPTRYRLQLQYRGFRRAQLAALVSFGTADQTPELQRVGLHPRPVLVIWGKHDPVVPFERSAQLLRVMSRARLVAVESAGHVPQWEQPAVTHAALIAFLHQ